jgi:hypothetical protein
MKLFLIFSYRLIFSFGVSLVVTKVLPPSMNGTISLDGWRLDHFNKELFWEEPPEGIAITIILTFRLV